MNEWLIAMTAVAVGVAIEGAVAWRLMKSALDGEMLARRLENRHDRLLAAGVDLFGAIGAVTALLGSIARVGAITKTRKITEVAPTIVPPLQAMTVAAMRIKQVADPEMKLLVDDVLDAGAAMIERVQLRKTDPAAEEAALLLMSERLLDALDERAVLEAYERFLATTAL